MEKKNEKVDVNPQQNTKTDISRMWEQLGRLSVERDRAMQIAENCKRNMDALYQQIVSAERSLKDDLDKRTDANEGLQEQQ